MYDLGFGRAYGGSGPEDAEGVEETDLEEIIRDSRAACASTHGKWGRSCEELEEPGAAH